MQLSSSASLSRQHSETRPMRRMTSDFSTNGTNVTANPLETAQHFNAEIEDLKIIFSIKRNRYGFGYLGF